MYASNVFKSLPRRSLRVFLWCYLWCPPLLCELNMTGVWARGHGRIAERGDKRLPVLEQRSGQNAHQVLGNPFAEGFSTAGRPSLCFGIALLFFIFHFIFFFLRWLVVVVVCSVVPKYVGVWLYCSRYWYPLYVVGWLSVYLQHYSVGSKVRGT